MLWSGAFDAYVTATNHHSRWSCYSTAGSSPWNFLTTGQSHSPLSPSQPSKPSEPKSPNLGTLFLSPTLPYPTLPYPAPPPLYPSLPSLSRP